jgi:hypothetical protein
MSGVNDELRPLVRMTVPRRARGLSLQDAPLGERAFHSVILAGGIVPVDVHALTLVRIDADGPSFGFLERSSSLAQRFWDHERTIAPDGAGGSVVRDDVWFSPRVRRLDPLLARVVRHVFEHRHRRLERRFSARS